MDELSNKVAIVTGSTKGIGKSIAEVFSQKGANVVVTSRNLSLAKEIVKNLNSYDTDPIAIKTDVTIDDDISNLIQTTKDHYGKIDILIDDGGHTNEQQIVTFLNTVENIKEDGLVIIEDTHTSYLEEFGNPSKYSFINFTISFYNLFFTNFIVTMNTLIPFINIKLSN